MLRYQVAHACLLDAILIRIDIVLKLCDRPLATIEHTHALRVGLLRLLPAIKAANKLIENGTRSELEPSMKWLRRRLGPLRELDLLIAKQHTPLAESPESIFATVLDVLRNQRLIERRHAAAAFRRPRFKLLHHRLTILRRLISKKLLVRSKNIRPLYQDNSFLPDLSRHSLNRCLNKLKRATQNFCIDDDPHHIRIQIKKLRYSIELFASIYPEGIAKRNLAKLKSLQDKLGDEHDRSTNVRLTRSLGVTRKQWRSSGLGISQQHKIKTLKRQKKDLREQLASIRHFQPFWKNFSMAHRILEGPKFGG